MTNDTARMQTADPARMACKDCIYREKDTVEIEGDVIQAGVMRGSCLIFDGKKGRWKPNNVYFLNEPCPFYEFDETAPRFWEKKQKSEKKQTRRKG